jgi:lysophospholipase L1-like esterase
MAPKAPPKSNANVSPVAHKPFAAGATALTGHGLSSNVAAQNHEFAMTNDIRICFVGDSFVNGTGDETALGWAGRLCAVSVAPHESRTNVREILRVARKYKVLMLGPPPVGEEEKNERIMSLSQAFAHEAKILGVPYIDLFSPLASDAEYKREVSSNDGSHPRSSGYTKMANVVASSPSWWFYAP